MSKIIEVEEEFFEHLLNCLANQKFVGELPPNGDALALGEAQYNQTQVDTQTIIDKAHRDGMTLLVEN